MKKILIADPLHSAALSYLEAQDGLSVTENTGLDEDTLVSTIGEFDALIVRSKTKVTARVLKAGTNLKAVGRAGIGTDNIDIPEATKHGIVVFNTPDANGAVRDKGFMAAIKAHARVRGKSEIVACPSVRTTLNHPAVQPRQRD